MNHAMRARPIYNKGTGVLYVKMFIYGCFVLDASARVLRAGMLIGEMGY